MDNLTHTVVGLAAGELVHRLLPEESNKLGAEANITRRRLFLTACALASNFPDLDLILTPLLDAPLGYLLHHRGHTHTALFAIAEGMILIMLLWFFWPKARDILVMSPRVRRGLGISVALGFALHISMDFLNSYGVHPFYPFNSKWFYGDTVFIIEPLFWIACGIPLAVTVGRRWLRAVWLILPLAAIFAFSFKGYIPWTSFVVLSAIAGFQGWLQKRSGMRSLKPMISAFAISLVFILIQSQASGLARERVVAKLKARDPGMQFVDAAMTAAPSSVLCWTFSAIARNEETATYRVTNGRLTLAPDFLPVGYCPSFGAGDIETISAANDFLILNEETESLMRLRAAVSESCSVYSWMRFARIPLITDNIASDLRFSSRGQSANFSTMYWPAARATECSPWTPQWELPRADLLEKPDDVLPQ